MEIDETKFAELVGNAVQKIVEPLISRLDKLEAGNGNNDDQNHNGNGNDDQNWREARDRAFLKSISETCQNYGKEDKFSGKPL